MSISLFLLAHIININMLANSLSQTFTGRFGLVLTQGLTKKIPNAHQRTKLYAKMPHIYRRVTFIRPPDLRDPNITFPIRIPMRVRHMHRRKKQELVDNSSKIHWDRLTPNQILLALEKQAHLSFREVVAGLKKLSEVQGQEKFDWNRHPWVKPALKTIRKKFNHIRQREHLKFYYLMKRLKYRDEKFWKKIYKKIEEDIYEVYPSEFQKLFLRYYEISDQYFSPAMKGIWLKLMEGRLREFQPSGILKVFEIYHKEKRLDDYWLYNVFIPLFKNNVYDYTPANLCQIFRFMMTVNHEVDERLYANLYSRVMKYSFTSLQEIEALQEVLNEVKELFVSHRVEPYLTHLQSCKEPVIKLSQEKKLSLHQIVREDLIFFMNKLKIEKRREKQRRQAKKAKEEKEAELKQSKSGDPQKKVEAENEKKTSPETKKQEKTSAD